MNSGIWDDSPILMLKNQRAFTGLMVQWVRKQPASLICFCPHDWLHYSMFFPISSTRNSANTTQETLTKGSLGKEANIYHEHNNSGFLKLCCCRFLLLEILSHVFPSCVCERDVHRKSAPSIPLLEYAQIWHSFYYCRIGHEQTCYLMQFCLVRQSVLTAGEHTCEYMPWWPKLDVGSLL